MPSPSPPAYRRPDRDEDPHESLPYPRRAHRARGLRHGTLSLPTLERIALAVAQHYHSEPGNQMHSRTARQAGLGLDEVALAKEWDSRDEREATLLRYLRSLVETQSQPPMHLHEEAREAGWTDEQILEAIAATALETFTAMVNVAGEVPVDGSWEDSRRMGA